MALAGGPGDGLTVEVRNALPATPGPEPVSPVAARVRLDGGTLDHFAAVDGLAATRALTHPGAPPPQVIVLTTFDEHRLVVEAVRDGAAGYLVEHAAPEGIVEAVPARPPHS
ncbi:hypothetical protein [Streptomyces botrytidirepellens]|uniref:hypothetical protein n=1 Tax=Streptomyces botrytidirepellens TaxID=2486417 RepID=UPI00161BC01B|nr:hypothetical protein [Streptomyces botrytidirepellens]